ncbi:MAG TPA: class I SAM-dependent methyltransferase [Actinomycetota bacterium]
MRTSAPARDRPRDGVRVYEDRWSSRRVVQVRPHLWRRLEPLLGGARILEIGSGLRPTAPARGSFFVERSPRAVRALRWAGGRAVQTGGWELPFKDGAFDAVLALELLEHVEEDERMLAEIVRVLRPGGTALVSVPLHMSLWSAIDDACAHVRRYEPDELLEKIGAAGLRSQGYLTRPAQVRPGLARLGIGFMSRFPRLSNWSLQHVVFPVASGWARAFGRVQWAEPGTPTPEGAGGMTVLATKG